MVPAPSHPPRVLFCSYHGYLDPSSGAALATRDLLELLAARGWACGVLSGPRLDLASAESLEDLLQAHGLACEVRHAPAGSLPFTLYHLVQGGVPVTLFDTPAARVPGPPTRAEGDVFLALFRDVLDRFRPDVLLTYGGNALAREVIATARGRGLPVVFHLHNFAYHHAAFFRPVDAVLVPSAFARDHYRRTLGLECTAIPYALPWDRVRCPDVDGRYATFVNPQPVKGLFWFARLALELGRQRPDIPLLVVEGRGQADWLGHTGLDLSGLTNLHRLANTPDPRDFYRVSRAVLMPSLWRESFGRVAAEACLNGLPVLASRRGALPEVLADAGLLLDIPERYTPKTRLVPTAAEVAPWVDALVRLWDDAALYEAERRRCLAAAEAWRPERLAPRYEEFFTAVARRRTAPHP
jgi:glycosyltransferase involved in cell wall biosynthesis